MSRRRLVQRTTCSGVDTSPISNKRLEPSAQASASSVLDLHNPPYYPLSCDAKRKLEELCLHHDFTKYKKALKDATNLITKSTYDCNDRLWQRKQKLQAIEERIKTSDNIDEKLKLRHKTEKEYTSDLEKKVEEVTFKSEKALRDLIDYGDELSIQSKLINEVTQKVITKPTTSQQSELNPDFDVNNLHQLESLSNDPVQKCIDLFRDAKNTYRTKYEKSSLRERYADHNDYKNFKGMIHDAQNQGPNARPLQHPKYWFSGDRSHIIPSHQHSVNEENEDDEIIMTSATTSLKCSFTLQYFEEPYSNRKCKHTYEKSAILDYLNTEGVVYSQPGQRGIRLGNKKITCPTPGCSVTLEHEDFYLDERIRQQVLKAQRFEANGDLADDSDEELSQPTKSVRRVILDDEVIPSTQID
ncbi:putative transcription factor c2h2 [Erysiphe neolycopersici]|uniref:Putative transcription factor c2h2 n=1 Tax=Erysiphe neolycopersici TaxID=212602 RepID=A0A420HID1_9PEZI|nr:putative transcription factor c2h2 [Erysiphe neolycopersici]